MEIKDKILSPGMLTQIQSTIDSQPEISRQRLSRLVCKWLDWRSPNGSYKEVSCRKALLKLHRQGKIKLPESKRHPNLKRSDSKINRDVFPEPQALKCTFSQVGHISLVPIQNGDRAQSRRWNAMMRQYHYLGAGPLCGAQIRYFKVTNGSEVIRPSLQPGRNALTLF